ncbi:MAG TPA: hypothetical protein PKE07_09475 [Lacibacter sp.]|nr:hypothetical protein [Lacibacter sp.]HMO89427.1 hypothetical protein [Lacibacter sp.]
MAGLNSWSRYLLYVHVVIAAGTVVLGLQTSLWLQLPLQIQLLIFLFFATLLSYNVHFWLASRKSCSSGQLDWFARHSRATLLLNLICLLVVSFYWYQLRAHTFPFLVMLFLNAAYTAPLLFHKEIVLPVVFTFMKSYFIGFTWALVTVLLPVLATEQPLEAAILPVFLQRFLLVTIATLIFDWRDKARDANWGVRTPANLFTEPAFNRFFLLHLLAYCGSVLLLLPLPGGWYNLLQLLPAVAMWYFYRRAKEEAGDVFYLLWVDGLLVLSPLLSFGLLL